MLIFFFNTFKIKIGKITTKSANFHRRPWLSYIWIHWKNLTRAISRKKCFSIHLGEVCQEIGQNMKTKIEERITSAKCNGFTLKPFYKFHLRWVWFSDIIMSFNFIPFSQQMVISIIIFVGLVLAPPCSYSTPNNTNYYKTPTPPSPSPYQLSSTP